MTMPPISTQPLALLQQRLDTLEREVRVLKQRINGYNDIQIRDTINGLEDFDSNFYDSVTFRGDLFEIIFGDKG